LRPRHQLRPQPLNQQQHQLQQLLHTTVQRSPYKSWNCTSSISPAFWEQITLRPKRDRVHSTLRCFSKALMRSFSECREQAAAALPHNPQASPRRRRVYPQGQLVPPGSLGRKGDHFKHHKSRFGIMRDCALLPPSKVGVFSFVVFIGMALFWRAFTSNCVQLLSPVLACFISGPI
jgi:hypothetical protein